MSSTAEPLLPGSAAAAGASFSSIPVCVRAAGEVREMLPIQRQASSVIHSRSSID